MKLLLNVVDLHYQKRKYIQTTGAYQGYSAVTGVAVYRFINYGLLVEIKVFYININFILFLRKTTTFFSLKDMFRQNFCHLQLNGKLQSKLNVK